MNQTNIGFIAVGGKQWMGGLYYVKNLISEMQLVDIKDRPNIFVFLTNSSANEFSDIKENIKVKKIILEDDLLDKCINRVSLLFFKRKLNLILFRKHKLENHINKYDIKYIYPVLHPLYKKNGKAECVFWIPDFQHKYLPEYFSVREIKKRNKEYLKISKFPNKLVFSSEDARDDFIKFYSTSKNEIGIIHFTSLMNRGEESDLVDVSTKYKLPKEYLFIPNQFWKHKDHITAFKALDILNRIKKHNITFVCSGELKDYRNVEYIKLLTEFIEEKNLKQNIMILGFIPKDDQIEIMKNCLAIIQPSLFEGWSTVVEDAKLYGKPIILSNLRVHIEQNPNKAVYFNKSSSLDLANKIDSNLDVFRGYLDNYSCKESMIERIESAKKYANNFIDFING